MRKLAVVLLFGAAACTPARQDADVDRSVLLSPRPALAERACEVVDTPLVLPAADLLVDSARLTADVKALWEGRDVPPGHALFSMVWDEHGFNARREIIEHDLPAEVADSLQELVFIHRKTGPEGEPWGVRLRVDVDEGASLRVGRQEYCAPKLLSAPFFDTPNVRQGAWSNPIRRAKRVRVIAHVRVDESGSPTDVRLQNSTLQARDHHQLLVLARGLRFLPALSDGIPVAAWTRVPLTVRIP